MDTVALAAAMIGAFCGAVVTYRVVKRQWWLAGATCGFAAWALLNTVTVGNRSRLEHNAVFAMGLISLAWFLVAAMMHGRRRGRL